jgi:SNF2 family DNA or RNA helicase
MFKPIIKAKKILLLTATPFVNRLTDLIPLINILHRNDRTKRRIDDKDNLYQKSLVNIGYLLNRKVSYFNEKSPEFFPEVRVHKIVTRMSRSFFQRYKKALDVGLFGSIPELYYNGFRRAVNAVGVEEYLNQKMDDVLKIIKNGEQTLIFTNWLENGVEVLKSVFEKKGVRYTVISGDVLPAERLGIVNQFNMKSVQVLIITMAGSEGLDLQETRNVIILDPVWNKAYMDQIIGRAVRYKSHISLPPEERYVDVYNLILESLDEEVPSGDELLYSIIERKTEKLKDVEEILKEVSI